MLRSIVLGCVGVFLIGARLDVAARGGKTPLAIADGKPTDGVYGHVNHPSTVN